MANHIFRGVHDTLLDIFGDDKLEWFYTDRSKQYYDRVYDEYISRNENEAIQLVKVGNIRGLMINNPAKVLAAYAEGGTGDNAEEYPFARLSQTVLFKCSATDCSKLGILKVNDTFDYEDIDPPGQNTGIVEGVLNYKYIRYKGEWYRVVDVKRENVVKGESAKVTFTAELPNNGINDDLGSQYIDIIDNVQTYTVYIDNEVYGEFGAGNNVSLTPLTKEGYEFAGYTSNDVDILNNQFTMPTNDVYITTNWTPKFEVTIDGNILGQYIAGTVVQIDAGKRDNFIFDKWTGYTVNDEYSAQTYFTMPNQNVALTTNWEQIAAKFEVYVDGAKIGEYEEGDRVDISAGTRQNYTFSKWTGNVSFANENSAQTYFTMINERVNVVSHWIANFWTVQIVSSYGYDDTYTISKGETFTLQYGTHSDERYGFSYWNIEGTYTGEIPNITPTSNIVATAEWQKLGDYSVTYQGYDHPKTWHNEGDTVNVSAPNKDGYDFENWRGTYKDSDTGRTQYVSFNSSLVNQVNSFTMPNADVTCKATYSEWAYTVTFTVDGTTYHTQQVAFSHKVSEPTAPTKEGYTFQYWKYQNKRVNFNDEIIENRTYTAYFIQDIIYRNVSLYNNGTLHTTIQVEDGQAISTAINELPTPTHDIDKRFNGWLNVITGAYLTLDTVINADTSFAANYTQLYSVSISGMTYTTTYYASGENVNIAAEDKTGKSFNEWTSSQVTFNSPTSSVTSFTMPAQSVEIVATYNDIYYTVTFYSDGAEYDTQSVIYGGNVNRPTDPTKQYHTFNEWQDSQGNSVDFTTQIYENKTYYADFTRNTFNLTYIVDNVTYATAQILAGNSISSFPTAPTPPTDYEFSGWYVNDNIVTENYIPQSDTTLTAHFELASSEVAQINQLKEIPVQFFTCTLESENDHDWNYFRERETSTIISGYTEIGDYGYATEATNLIMYGGTEVGDGCFDLGVNGLYNGDGINTDYLTNFIEEGAATPANERYPLMKTHTLNTNSDAGAFKTLDYALPAAVLYSKWRYDPYDEDAQHMLQPPSVEIVNGKRRLTVSMFTINTSLKATGNPYYYSNAVLQKVTPVGMGWYRYEFIRLYRFLYRFDDNYKKCRLTNEDTIIYDLPTNPTS